MLCRKQLDLQPHSPSKPAIGGFLSERSSVSSRGAGVSYSAHTAAEKCLCSSWCTTPVCACLLEWCAQETAFIQRYACSHLTLISRCFCDMLTWFGLWHRAVTQLVRAATPLSAASLLLWWELPAFLRSLALRK